MDQEFKDLYQKLYDEFSAFRWPYPAMLQPVSDLLTLMLFIISILNGGAGISRMTREGYAGNWCLDVGTPYFKRQTLICLLGILLFFGSLFLSGPTKEESQAREVKTLQDKVQTQELHLNAALSELQQLRNDLSSSKEEVKRLGTKSKDCGKRAEKH